MQNFRVLITGAAGFVGGYLASELISNLDNVVVLRTSRLATIPDVVQLDVTKPEEIAAGLKSFSPTHVVHLAGISTLSGAEKSKDANWRINFQGALNIADKILELLPDCALIFVSSGQVYGKSAERGGKLSEALPLFPLNEYAAAKSAAEMALASRTTRGLKLVRLRPFNHTGPGQSTQFALPNFARQIVEIERGAKFPEISVGNLDVKRDFLDVRDVAAAYRQAIVNSDGIDSGTAINVASGNSVSIRYLLNAMLSLSVKSISVETDANLIRNNDMPEYVGSNNLAKNLLLWSPKIKIEQTLADILEHTRNL